MVWLALRLGLYIVAWSDKTFVVHDYYSRTWGSRGYVPGMLLDNIRWQQAGKVDVAFEGHKRE